jgi:hypothetical protein
MARKRKRKKGLGRMPAALKRYWKKHRGKLGKKRRRRSKRKGHPRRGRMPAGLRRYWATHSRKGKRRRRRR